VTKTLAIALALALPFAAQAKPAPSSAAAPAAWIEKMTHALWPSDAVHARATLESKDANGEGLDTELELVRDQRGDDVRTQLRVVAPEGAAGTVYEIDAHGGKKLERSVYLAPVRRVRDLRGLRRTDSFLGSEFSYEDLEIAAPRESEWRRAQLIHEGGRALEKVTSAPYSYYERVETVLDPKTDLPVRVSFYDRDGVLYKRETFGDPQTIDGHVLPTRIEMDDVQTGAKSVLRLHDIELGRPIDEALFTNSPLAQHAAR